MAFFFGLPGSPASTGAKILIFICFLPSRDGRADGVSISGTSRFIRFDALCSIGATSVVGKLKR